MQSSSVTWNYTYDAGGLRTSRSNGSTTYRYWYNDRGLLLRMEKGNTVYSFTYDPAGRPVSVTEGSTRYYYVLNQQGDVIGLMNGNKKLVVEYYYDAWGRLIKTNGDLATTLGVNNPLRYRGYVYDTETGLYYLQSRYYNPTIGRFINADGAISTGQGVLGYNMFAYCGNNPVSRCDSTGKSWILTITITAVAFLLGGCSSDNKDEVLVVSNKDSGWQDSSKAMGQHMALAVGAGIKASTVAMVDNSNFANVWNNTSSSYVIIHTHGSPNGFFGTDLSFTTKDMSQLNRNSNIQLVLITACETGGTNGNNRNIAQALSQAINPNGIVVCSTTVVSGADTYFTATNNGQWIAYQNGMRLPTNLPQTITVYDVVAYWKDVC